MSNLYIGIDPGSKGFIAIISKDGSPKFIKLAKGNDFNPTTEQELAMNIDFIKKAYPLAHCAIEDVHALFGSSAKSTFNFGYIVGFIKALLTANHISYTSVPPKTWQKEIWTNADIVYETKTDSNGKTRKVINTKQTSFNACARLYPDVDLRASEKCKNKDDNKCDALLIATYAMRKNL